MHFARHVFRVQDKTNSLPEKEKENLCVSESSLVIYQPVPVFVSFAL